MTLWFSYVYTKHYKPLMKFIALRSIRRAEQATQNSSRLLMEQRLRAMDSEEITEAMVDAEYRYVNPSLIAPLENVWITNKTARTASIMSRSPPPEEEGPENLDAVLH